MLVVDRRKCDLVPALADRKAAVVEIAAGAGFGEADQRHRLRASPFDSPISDTKVSTLTPVAASALATDSVEGQRARPSGVMRFDLLKVVGSRPDRLARPDGDSFGARGEPVERGPDLVVGQRCACHPGLRLPG